MPPIGKILPKIITPKHGKMKLSPDRNFSYDLIAQVDKSVTVLAKFVDVFNRASQTEMARHQFNNFTACYKILTDAGYPWSNDIELCKQFHQSWCDAPPRQRIISVPNPGWHQGRYLHLDTPKFINGKKYLYRAAGHTSQSMPEGSEDEWQQLINCVTHSPAMVFGLSLLFGSALLAATNLPNVSLYWWSTDALERTAFTKAITSMGGGRGNVQLWNKSPSEIDVIARDCNYFTLCSEARVDEPKFVKQLPDVMFWLNSSRYRLFSTLVGEHPLSGTVRRNMKKLISLSLECDPDFGMCESLPSGFARQLSL